MSKPHPWAAGPALCLLSSLALAACSALPPMDFGAALRLMRENPPATTVSADARGWGAPMDSLIAAAAPHLAAASAAPVASTPLGTLETDGITDLGGDMALVGTVHVGADGGAAYGAYIAVDARAGRELWRAERVPDPFAIHEAVGLPDAVLLSVADERGTRYAVLDRASGDTLWTRTLDTDHAILSTVDGESLVFARDDRSGTELTAHAVRSGAQTWTARVPDTKGAPSLTPHGQDLLLRTEGTLALLRGLDGRLAWRLDDLGPPAGAAGPVETADGLLVPSLRHLRRVSDRGAVMWTAELTADLAGLGTGAALVLAVTTDDGGIGVVALDASTGQRRWQGRLPGRRLASNLLVQDSILAFDTRAADAAEVVTHLLDVLDGSPRHELARPSEPSALASRLVGYRGRVVVADEMGAAAYDVRTGRTLWEHRPSTRSTWSDAREHWAAVLQDAPPGTRRAEHLVALSTAGFDRSMVRMAQQHQAAVYTRTASTLARNSGASLTAREGARQARIAAIQQTMIATRRQQREERSAATMQFSMALMDLGTSIARLPEQRAFERARTNALIRQRVAERSHRAQVQGDYYLRGTRGGAEFRGTAYDGLLVVDLRTGRWAEILTSPFVGALDADDPDHAGGVGSSLPTILEGGLVVDRGAGLDPARWSSTAVGISKVPLSSLLAFELDAIELRSPDEHCVVGPWGYVDTAGRMLLAAEYDEVRGYSDGTALARKKDRWLLVGLQGERPLPTDIKHVGLLAEGRLPFGRAEGAGYMDVAGRVVVSGFSAAHPFSEGRGAVAEGTGREQRWGFVDAEGRVVVEPRFGEVYPFSEGLAVVQQPDGTYGYIDPAGEWAIEPSFDRAHAFRNGRAWVVPKGGSGDDGGFIDRTGAFVLRGFPRPSAFADGLAPRDSTYVDVRGATVFTVADAECVEPFSHGLGRVNLEVGHIVSYCDRGIGGWWGFVDRTGAFAIAPRYRGAFDFSDGLAAVRTEDGWGFIDTAGQTVLPPRWLEARPFRDGAAAVRAAGLACFPMNEG